MATKTRTVEEMTYGELVADFRPASYHFGDRWCPAVHEKDGGYSIRVVKSETRSGSSANTTYDYFRLDESGLVVESPRGYAREYTKQVRITDIAKVAKRMEKPDPKAPRFRLGF